jgi:hypothetical protein
MEVPMADQKCPVHGRKLERPALGVPSYSWATGYTSLANLAPIQPVTLACPEKGCDHREVAKE